MEILAYLATCQCRKDNRLLVLTNILLQYDYKILHSWPFLFWTNVQIWCCFLVSLLIPIPCVLSELAITSVTTVVATAVAIPEATIPAAWQAKKMRQILPWNIPFSMLLLHLQRFQVPSSLSSVCHAPSWRRSSHSSLNENSGVVMWSDTLTLMRPDRDIISGLCFSSKPCRRGPVTVHLTKTNTAVFPRENDWLHEMSAMRRKLREDEVVLDTCAVYIGTWRPSDPTFTCLMGVFLSSGPRASSCTSQTWTYRRCTNENLITAAENFTLARAEHIVSKWGMRIQRL